MGHSLQFKFNRVIYPLGLFLTAQPNTNNWDQFYVKAIMAIESKDFTQALSCFSKAIEEDQGAHPYLFAERAKVYYLENNHQDVIEDVTSALRLGLTGKDREIALLTRSRSFFKLGMYDEGMSDFYEFRKVSSLIPMIERTQNYIIIRNLPDDSEISSGYKKTIANIFGCNEEHIQELSLEIYLIKISDCNFSN